MSASLTIDSRQFTAAIRELARVKNDTLKNIVNQAALDVSGYNFDNTPPYGSSAIEGRRAKIKAYLRQQLSSKFKFSKKGKSRARGKAATQLQRVHLIIQARRKRQGKRGLYGGAMKAAAGKFVGNAQKSVGFLKSIFIPIIVGLNRHAKYKFPYAKTKGISRWPGGSGYGRVDPARSGWNAVAILQTKIIVADNQAAKIGAQQNLIMREALEWKAGKMRREAERILSAEFFKVSAHRGIQTRATRAPR